MEVPHARAVLTYECDDTAAVAAVMRWCSARQVPVDLKGSDTGLSTEVAPLI